MKHLYIEGKSEWTLILLHGMGGRETDLLEVATMTDSHANILAFRGNVIENNQTRFFKRHAHNQFDDESLKEEGGRLYNAINECSKAYNINLSKAIFIGYSNGANMAAYILLNKPLNLAGAVLMHPAYHSGLKESVSLLDQSFLITAGARDMTALAGDAYQLKKQLELRGGVVTLKLNDGQHAIVSEELMEAHIWFMRVKKQREVY